MRRLRFDPAAPPPLFTISWNEDSAFRMNPRVVTTLLREQVPVLDFVQWEVTAIDPGEARSRLPLNPQSTNQHFTHQAALFLLAADYTGGTALASLLSGWPVIGVHPVRSAQSASLWLLKGEIKYLRPSVADLDIFARIQEDHHDRIRGRFLDGKAVIETIQIQFFNRDCPVGEASLTYFARQSEKLRAEGVDVQRVNTLYELKLTSSAELIAGVRAREHGRGIDDPYAADMAGQHGRALAERFCARSPQLGGMISARTRHLDTALCNFLFAGGRKVALVGVGWDMRPFRLPFPPGTHVFELDFPTTLAERHRRLAQLGLSDPPGITRVDVPIDLRTMPLAETLRPWLSNDDPVFIAWEGMSMYFQEEEVHRILDGMRPLMNHPESMLWVDFVDRRAVDHPEEISPSVENFMRGMQILGEPFTFGPESVEAFLHEAGLRCLEAVTSDLYLRACKDPVYSIYKLCLAASGNSSTAEFPAGYRPARARRRFVSPPHLSQQVYLDRHRAKNAAPSPSHDTRDGSP